MCCLSVKIELGQGWSGCAGAMGFASPVQSLKGSPPIHRIFADLNNAFKLGFGRHECSCCCAASSYVPLLVVVVILLLFLSLSLSPSLS